MIGKQQLRLWTPNSWELGHGLMVKVMVLLVTSPILGYNNRSQQQQYERKMKHFKDTVPKRSPLHVYSGCT